MNPLVPLDARQELVLTHCRSTLAQTLIETDCVNTSLHKVGL